MTDDVKLSQIDLIDDDDAVVDAYPCSPSSTSLVGDAPHDHDDDDDDDDADSQGSSAGDAFAEIATEVAVPDHDCLTVLCDGLSPAELIVSSIVASGTKPTDLILLVNLSSASDVSSRLSALEQYVRDRLALLDVPLPMTKVSSAIPALVRQRLYIAGHVFSMPTTTASVDLIQGVLPAHLIKGVIILDAHRAVQGSREALVLRLIRDGCRPGARRPFVKLFTSNASALDGDRHRLERVLVGTGVRQVHFWPRFRVRLRRVLARTPIDDIAVALSLTDAQTQIQAAVQQVLQICVDEALGSARRYLPDLVLPEGKAALATQPDLRLRRLLQPTWHRVGPKTRQLIADIALLRKLFALLVGADCVSFYRFLRSVQATPRMQHSQWLLTPQADRLFKLAKRRVYSVASAGPRLVRHLQANPKWALLRQILDEIAADGIPRSGPLLIICEDVSSCGALRELLRVGADAFLEKRWFQFLQSLRLERVADPDASDEQQRDDEVSKAFAAKRIELCLLRDEYRRLVEARKNSVNAAAEPLVQTTLSQFGVVSKTTAKRGRKKAKLAAAAPLAPKPAPAVKTGSVSLVEALFAAPAGTVPIILEDSDDLPLMFWARGSDFIPLHLLNPMYVIVYDSDVGVLRQLEMAKSRRPAALHRVYTVMYEDSVEDALHQERIRRECDVFESLAQQKARMVLPSIADASPAPQVDLGSTRQGGGGSTTASDTVVIVDLREFRSSLPGTLYEAGVRIVPVTLEVGDYVLAPDLCVERKSVADLVGSLNSGRLFAQLTAMKRFYQYPFLLIEFDANDPFTFQLDLRWAVSASQICTRLAMICLAFPEIRIMWSRSPQTTASIFARLKAGRPQPDVAKAAMIANDDDDHDAGSYVASDMLRRLPGVTPANIHQLMRSATCLADLARLDRASLNKALGSRPAAANLLEFLHADMAPT